MEYQDEINEMIKEMINELEEPLYQNPSVVHEIIDSYKDRIAICLMDENNLDEYEAYKVAMELLEDAFERYFGMEIPGKIISVYGIGCTGRYPRYPYDVSVTVEWEPERYEDDYNIIED